MAIRCPICQSDQVSLVGPANETYPPAFRCYSHGEHTFSVETPEAYERSNASIALSASNAAALRAERKGESEPVSIELPSGTAVRVSTSQQLLLRLPSLVAPLPSYEPVFITFEVPSSKTRELAGLLEQLRLLLERKG